MKKIIISLVSAILICIVAYCVILTAFWDLEIHICRPADRSGSYHEPVTVSGGLYFSTKTANENSTDFVKKNSDFFLEFYEEHKEDVYKLDTYVTFEDGKTIVTYKGTITDNETGVTSPYEEQLVFDYIFTKTVNE